MQKSLKWKLFTILALMVACLYYFVSPRQSGNGLLSRINLGLDLKGGVHLVLQVVTDDAINQDLNQDAQRIAQDLDQKKIPLTSSQKGNGYTVEVKGIDPTQDRDVRAYLDNTFARKYSIRSTIAEGKTNYTLSMLGSYLRDMQDSTVKQALETIRRRVDALGVTEPTLQIYGSPNSPVQDEIIVELPGIDDPDRVKSILENTAQLELRLVKKDNGGPFPSVEAAVQANGGKIPDGYSILVSRD